jgi:hypothetical protein
MNKNICVHCEGLDKNCHFCNRTCEVCGKSIPEDNEKHVLKIIDHGPRQQEHIICSSSICSDKFDWADFAFVPYCDRCGRTCECSNNGCDDDFDECLSTCILQIEEVIYKGKKMYLCFKCRKKTGCETKKDLKIESKMKKRHFEEKEKEEEEEREKKKPKIQDDKPKTLSI